MMSWAAGIIAKIFVRVLYLVLVPATVSRRNNPQTYSNGVRSCWVDPGIFQQPRRDQLRHVGSLELTVDA